MGNLLSDALALVAEVVRPRANTAPAPGLGFPWGWGAISVRSAGDREVCDDCARAFRPGDDVHVMPDLAEVHTRCAKARLEALEVDVPSLPPLRTPEPPGGSYERS